MRKLLGERALSAMRDTSVALHNSGIVTSLGTGRAREHSEVRVLDVHAHGEEVERSLPCKQCTARHTRR